MYRFQPYLINLLLVFSGFAFSGQGEIKKPLKDEREYRAFKLENEIQVFLIHDDKAENSTAALSVGVGSFQDPKSRQGLAHFLEHMILIQSEKYPETNGLRAFVEANGGWTNAYTSSRTTDYIASASHTMFAPLLERVSAAIEAPIFDSTYVDKEVNAIDAEWYRQNQTNSFYFNRVLAATSNKRHPTAKLNVGNRKTLLSKHPSKINDDLEQFHQRYYSSNLMNLVLAGPQTLDELEQLAIDYFSNIPNNAVVIKETEEPIFNKRHLKKHIYVKTRGDLLGLTMQFALPRVEEPWRKKSFSYISMLLNSKQKGSLIDVLKDAGLIRDMQANLLPNVLSSASLAEFSFELTKEGVDRQGKIVATTFDFIGLIQKEGITAQYEEQISKRIKSSLAQYLPPALGRSAINIARGLHTVEPENVIFTRYFFEGIDQQEIRHLLSKLRPDNMRLLNTGPDLETSKTLKDAFGSYAYKRISKKERSRWESGSLSASLMKVERTTTVEKAFKVAFDKAYSKPQVVQEQLNTRVILAHSERFQDKTGYFTLVLRNPFTTQSVENWVYSQLLHQIIGEQIQAYQEAERINTGSIVSTALDSFGNTTFTIYGESQHHSRILLELLNRFKEMSISENELENSQFKMLSLFENWNSYSAREQLSFYRGEASQTSQIFKRTDILEALTEVDLEDLSIVHKSLYEESFIDIFAMGNYDKEKLLALTEQVNTIIPQKSGLKNWRFESPFAVTPRKKLSYNAEMLQRGIAIADTYISPQKSESLAAQVYVLSFIMSEPAHSALRTEQQLGYAVSLWTSPLHDYPAITFRIESNSTDLPELKARITDFIATYKQTLDAYSEEELLRLKQAIIANTFREPDSLLREVNPLLNDWARNNLEFDSVLKRRKVIEATTKQDLIALYDKLFSSDAANFVVQLKGIDYADSAFFHWENEASD
jgi:protease-3